MTRYYPKVPRSALRASAIALFVLIGTAGCYKHAGIAVPAGLSGYPGQDPAATANYVRSLDFSVTDSIFSGPLECESPAACGNSPTVNIRVIPERRAFRAPVDHALGNGPGHVVARIENLENKPFAPYGLAPNDTAYLWVGALQSGPRRIAIVRISAAGQARLLATAQQAGWCPGSNANRVTAAVHINPNPMCADRPLYQGAASGASRGLLASANTGHGVLMGAVTAAFSHARGLWFSCSMGCCEARGFEAEQQ